MFSKILKLSRKYAQKATSLFLALYLTLSPLLSFPLELFAASAPVVTINGFTPQVNAGYVSGVVDIMGTVTDVDGDLDFYNLSIYPDGVDTWDFSYRIVSSTVTTSGLTNQSVYTWDTTSGLFPDGVYQIRLAARDLAGNRDPETPTTYNEQGDSVKVASVIVDNTDPVVDITSHVNGDVVGSGLINIAGTVNDTNLWRYYFVVKNSGGTVIAGPGTVNNAGPIVNPSFNWDTTALAEGNYTVNLSARDLANNKEEPGVSGKTITLTLDKTAAVTTLSSPSDNFSTNLPINISGETHDANGVDYVTLYSRAAGTLDPWVLFETVDNATDSADFIWSYDWTPSSDGVYDIKASSVDVAGNVEASAYAYTITYDTTGPIAPTPISPADGAAIRPIAFTQTWSSVVDAVQYRYQSCNVDPGDAGGTCSSVKFTSTHAGTSKSVGAGQPDSHFWWRVQAKDALGNWGDYSESFELIIDGTAPQDPSSFISSHAPGGYSFNNEIVMEWPAVDDAGGASDALSGVDGYSYSFSLGAQETPDNVKDLEENELIANSGILSDGIWWFNIRTVDNAGNWTSTEHYGPVGIDTVAPAVSITFPADGELVDIFTAYGTSSDLTSEVETISVDFKDDLGAVVVNCLGSYSSSLDEWTLDVNGVSSCSVVDGVYDIEVTAADSAGNTNSAEVLDVVIDNTAPVVGSLNLVPDYSPFVNGNLFIATMTVSDATAGIDEDSCEISYDGGSTWESAGYSNLLGARCVKVATGISNGLVMDVVMKVSDLLGHVSYSSTLSRTADSDDPVSQTTIAETYYGPATFMSDSINGTSDDSVSGVSEVRVSVRRSSDNKYWTESSIPLLKWINSVRRLDVSGINTWTYSGITSINLTDGVQYTVTPYTRDEVNNPSALGWATGTSDSFIWDSSAPTDPSDFTTSHISGDYSNDNTVDIEWPAVGDAGGASDSLSGVDGYSYSFSFGGLETPDDVKDLEQTDLSASSGTLVDGEWWFNIRTVDNVGNWTSTEHYGPIYIDTVSPVVTIDQPTDSEISNALNILGTATDDFAGVDEVTLELTGILGTITCGTTYDSLTGEWMIDDGTCSSSVVDDVYTILATVSDNAGNTGTDGVTDYMLDTTAPSDPSDFVSSHLVNIPTSLNSISIDWPSVGDTAGASDNLSGVAGYSYLFSDSAVDLPDDVADLLDTETETSSGPLADGTWYFHLRTLDNAGNWTSTAHYGPMIVDTTAPVITLVGGASIVVTQGDAYVDAGATASDVQDGNLTSSIVVNNPVDTDVLGTYTVTYNVSDSAGNDAAEVEREVIVEAVPAAPTVLGEDTEEEEETQEEEGEVLGLQCEVKQTLTGYVYIDGNKNGQRDEGEEGIAGVELDLVYTSDGEEVVVDTVVTDSNGRWKAEVCPGDYEVRLDEDTLPENVNLNGEDVLGISVEDGSGEHNLNFDLTQVAKGFEWKWVVIGLVSLLFVFGVYKFFTKGVLGSDTPSVG